MRVTRVAHLKLDIGAGGGLPLEDSAQRVVVDAAAR